MEMDSDVGRAGVPNCEKCGVSFGGRFEAARKDARDSMLAVFKQMGLDPTLQRSDVVLQLKCSECEHVNFIPE